MEPLVIEKRKEIHDPIVYREMEKLNITIILTNKNPVSNYCITYFAVGHRKIISKADFGIITRTSKETTKWTFSLLRAIG